MYINHFGNILENIHIFIFYSIVINIDFKNLMQTLIEFDRVFKNVNEVTLRKNSFSGISGAFMHVNFYF